MSGIGRFTDLNKLIDTNPTTVELSKTSSGQLSGKTSGWMTFMSGINSLLGWKPTGHSDTNKASAEALLSYISDKSDPSVRTYVEKQVVKLASDPQGSNWTLQKRMADRGTYLNADLLKQVRDHADAGTKLLNNNREALADFRGANAGKGEQVTIGEYSFRLTPFEKKIANHLGSDAVKHPHLLGRITTFTSEYCQGNLTVHHPLKAKIDQALDSLATKATAEGRSVTNQEVEDAAIKAIFANIEDFVIAYNAEQTKTYCTSNECKDALKDLILEGHENDYSDWPFRKQEVIGKALPQALADLSKLLTSAAQASRKPLDNESLGKLVKTVGEPVVEKYLKANWNARKETDDYGVFSEFKSRLGLFGKDFQNVYLNELDKAGRLTQRKDLDDFVRATVGYQPKEIRERFVAAGKTLGQDYMKLASQMGETKAREHITNLAESNPAAKRELSIDSHLKEGTSCLDKYTELVRKSNTFMKRDEFIAFKAEVRDLYDRVNKGALSNLSLLFNHKHADLAEAIRGAQSPIRQFCKTVENSRDESQMKYQLENDAGYFIRENFLNYDKWTRNLLEEQ